LRYGERAAQVEEEVKGFEVGAAEAGARARQSARAGAVRIIEVVLVEENGLRSQLRTEVDDVGAQDELVDMSHGSDTILPPHGGNLRLCGWNNDPQEFLLCTTTGTVHRLQYWI
jgi:hypothetical protein